MVKTVSSIALAAAVLAAGTFAPTGAVEAADKRVCVKNSGGFVARFEVDYDRNDIRLHTHSGNFTAGTQKCIGVPEDASNMMVSIQEEYFIASWSTVCQKSFDTPVNIDATVKGTTLNASCSGL